MPRAYVVFSRVVQQIGVCVLFGMVSDIAVATHIAVYMIPDLIFHTCLIILPIM